MRTLKLELLILVTPFSLFSVPSYGESKGAPVEIVAKTYNRVLVQANKDGPRLAIDEKEAGASASGKEVILLIHTGYFSASISIPSL